MRIGTTPVPASVTDCGLPGASCVITSVADRLPEAEGRKLTLTVLLLPGAIARGTASLVTVKSAALVPCRAMLETFSVA